MILNELTLRNFCLYHGEQSFDLTINQSRGKRSPIVLFGGINGGGKTTLLDAVQLVLYGIRAKCSKRNDKPYDVFLRESIHHAVDPSEGAEVKLSFRYATEGKDFLYEVSRSWSDIRGRIKEQVRVTRDGELDNWLSENWSQIVEELIPFGVAQLCFFDAEKIRFLADDETSTEALGGAIKSLLGLDLAERLVADASVLEGRIAKRTKESKELNKVRELERILEEKYVEIKRLVQEEAAANNPKEKAEERVYQAKELFAKTGGEHWEQREDKERCKISVEHDVEALREKLVAIAGTELPLAMVGELLGKLNEHSEEERAAVESDITTKMLQQRDKQVLSKLKAKSIPDASIKIFEEVLAIDREARTNKSNVEMRHLLSHNAKLSLEQLQKKLLKDRKTTADKLLKQLDMSTKELEDLQRSLAATPDEEAIQDVAKELTDATKELAKCDQIYQRIAKQLQTARNEKEDIDGQLAKLRRKVVDEEIKSEEDARLANLLVKTQATMSEFLKRATEKKISHLSELVGESFRFLLRKTKLIQRVDIHPETFAITLIDSEGREVPKQRLSEGEKQIFAISVLWGLSRASARPLPALIDTPMGRLDAKHRNQLVERYFPHASHQVIILSTDTEIERAYFHRLQPHISRGYHLNYNEHEKLTIAEEGYFWEMDNSERTKEEVVG